MIIIAAGTVFRIATHCHGSPPTSEAGKVPEEVGGDALEKAPFELGPMNE